MTQEDILRRHFLIVDDDPIFLAVAEGVILSLGDHEVTSANGGEEGLSVLRAGAASVDTIILDLNMPGIDGLAFLSAVSETGFAGELVISSGEAASIISSARHLGDRLGLKIVGSLHKPLTRQAVIDLFAGRKKTIPAAVSPKVPAPAPIGGTILAYYQPQFDLGTGQVNGLEALARLRADDGHILGPAVILDAIEDHDQLMDFTFTIIAAVFGDIRYWRAQAPEMRVSINMDTRVLEDPSTRERLAALQTKFDIPPQAVTFEMTETSVPTNMAGIIEILARLRMLGYGLSLDDYGTGGANFELLRVAPFSELKIDQSFVRSAAREPASRRFLEFCVTTAAELELRLVAEGIETEDHLRLCRDLGITTGQGYLLSRPVPLSELAAIIASCQRKR